MTASERALMLSERARGALARGDLGMAVQLGFAASVQVGLARSEGMSTYLVAAAVVHDVTGLIVAEAKRREALVFERTEAAS